MIAQRQRMECELLLFEQNRTTVNGSRPDISIFHRQAGRAGRRPTLLSATPTSSTPTPVSAPVFPVGGGASCCALAVPACTTSGYRTTLKTWRSLKYEHVYLHVFDDLSEARTSIGAFFEFYNHQRRHQALGYSTPDEFYRAPSQAA